MIDKQNIQTQQTKTELDNFCPLDCVVGLPTKIYHCTTPKKAKRYKHSGMILKPVRGFENITAAMAWCMRTGRSIIYEIETKPELVHKLPDHHNKFGRAFWIDDNITEYKCAWSSNSK